MFYHWFFLEFFLLLLSNISQKKFQKGSYSRKEPKSFKIKGRFEMIQIFDEILGPNNKLKKNKAQ